MLEEVKGQGGGGGGGERGGERGYNRKWTCIPFRNANSSLSLPRSTCKCQLFTESAIHFLILY